MKTMYRLTNEAYFPSKISHTRIVGISGTGKDFIGERYLAKQKNKKRIDFFSLERHEGMMYSIPQDNEYLINQGKLLTNGCFKPQSFQNEVYIISGKKLQDYKSLPANFKIVSLKEEDIDTQDIIYLLGSTNSAVALLYMILFDIEEREGRSKITLTDVEDCCRRISEGGDEKWHGASRMTAFVIRRNISILRRSGIFDDRFPSLEVEDLMVDWDVITSFSAMMLETSVERAVALGIILKMICDFQKKQKFNPTALYFRELQAIYNPSTHKEEDFYGMLRNYLYFILTEGRDLAGGTSLIANYQVIDQVPDYINNHFPKTICLRQPATQLKKLNAPINNITLAKIPQLKKGEFLWLSNGVYEYPCFSIPPPFKKKEPGDNVFQILIDKYGEKEMKMFEKKSNYNNTPNLCAKKKVKDIEISTNIKVFG